MITISQKEPDMYAKYTHKKRNIKILSCINNCMPFNKIHKVLLLGLLGSCLPSLTQTSSGYFRLHPPDSTTEGPPTICQIHSEIKIIIFTSSFSLSHYFAVNIVMLCLTQRKSFFVQTHKEDIQA